MFVHREMVPKARGGAKGEGEGEKERNEDMAKKSRAGRGPTILFLANLQQHPKAGSGEGSTE